jgi:hypothetical protein
MSGTREMSGRPSRDSLLSGALKYHSLSVEIGEGTAKEIDEGFLQQSMRLMGYMSVQIHYISSNMRRYFCMYVCMHSIQTHSCNYYLRSHSMLQ